MNAWYFHYEGTWPPSNSIDPLITSIHINLNDEKVINSFISDESLEYMKRHGPIGARDISTLNFLKDNNIPSYFSGCLTLTLDKNPNIKKQEYIVTVDVPEEVINFLKTKTNKKIYNITQMVPLNMNEPNETRISLYNSKEKFILANSLLDLLINNYTYDVDRFGGLKNLLRNTPLDEYISNYEIFDINNPPENKKDYLKLRNELINICKNFTGHINNERTKFYPEHSNFYISLISNNSKEINKYITKNNLLYKDKLNEIIKKDKMIIKQNKKIFEMKSSNSWKITKPLRFIRNFFK